MSVVTGTKVRTKNETPTVEAGKEGVITYWDSWSSEEYPYHVRFDNGVTAAFARHELQVI